MRVFRAKTDGTDFQEVLPTPARLWGWLAVDPVRGTVYWADTQYSDSVCVLTRGEVRADGLRGVNVGVSRAMALDYILPREAACSVTANDEDADGDRLTAVVVAAPENGSLTLHADGSFEYVPSGQFVGTDRFVYKLSDGHDESRPATVTIDVGE